MRIFARKKNAHVKKTGKEPQWFFPRFRFTSSFHQCLLAFDNDDTLARLLS